MRFRLANRGGEFSCSSRSGGSGVRVSARPDIFASDLPRRLASDHRVSIDLQHYTAGSPIHPVIENVTLDCPCLLHLIADIRNVLHSSQIGLTNKHLVIVYLPHCQGISFN
jgi:hypothetical protein